MIQAINTRLHFLYRGPLPLFSTSHDLCLLCIQNSLFLIVSPHPVLLTALKPFSKGQVIIFFTSFPVMFVSVSEGFPNCSQASQQSLAQAQLSIKARTRAQILKINKICLSCGCYCSKLSSCGCYCSKLSSF